MSGSASSFEYINLNRKSCIESTQTRIEKTTSSVSGVIKKISLSKNTTESSSLSKTSSEDIDLHLRILQKLLRTKKLQSSTKRKYIHKLLKEFNQLETSNESNSSSDFFVPKKNLRVDFKETGSSINPQRLEPAKNHEAEESSAPPLASKSSLMAYETRQVEDDNCNCKPPYVSTDLTQPKSQPKISNNSIDFLPASCSGHKNPEETRRIMPNKSAESTSSSASRKSSDYLLKFAENERSYQLHWINNEISHLCKLKNILELKSIEPARSKTSTYHVAQSGSGQPSSRDYVIQTKEQFPLGRNINYMLEGKEYVVSDSQKSSNHGDNCVLADIVVDSDENGTNIKVRTICSICKQVVCICPPKTETPQSQSSALGGGGCFTCRKSVCVCQPTSANDHISAKSSSSEEEIKEPIDLRFSDIGECDLGN